MQSIVIDLPEYRNAVEYCSGAELYMLAKLKENMPHIHDYYFLAYDKNREPLFMDKDTDPYKYITIEQLIIEIISAKAGI